VQVASRKAGDKRGRQSGRITAGVRPVSGSSRTPRKLEDLFGGGVGGDLLHGDFEKPNVYAWFQKRHKKVRELIGEDGIYRSLDGEHEWKVPYGVREATKTSLAPVQIVNRYPWSVTWVSPKTGVRLTKKFSTLIGSIHFIATRVQYVDPKASIIARQAGYFVPAKLRGKFPLRRGKHVYYWCPYCMDARRFRRRGDDTFHALKKFWNEEKGRYDWKEVKLAVLNCTCCGISNRDPKWRSSNQPYEKRRIKQGVRRVKRRRQRR
jgi:hypothetical protein